MVTGVDVEVLGGHHVPVARLTGQVVVDRSRQGGAAGHRQRAALAEIVLHVDDDQGSHASHPIRDTVSVSTLSCGDNPCGLFAGRPGNPAAMLIRRIARPLLSVVFIGQGIDSLRNPKLAAEAAAPAVDGLQSLPDPVGSSIPSDPQTFAQVNAAVQIGGGLLLATGKLPRVASAALALTVLPANLGAHMFWAEQDPQRKAQKRQAFLTDLSLLGGLLIASADTAGKPSLGWRGRRAAERLSERVSSALPGSSDAFDPDFSEFGERIAHGLQVGAERGRELASTAAERGAPLAEAALERGRELASTAAERSAPLAKKARKRGEELASTAADKAEPLAKKARKRGEELASTAADKAEPLAKKARKRGEELASVARERGLELAETARQRGSEFADASHWG
jgi:uncharacterized membrane protein YphA (DoxX/SURF4 family)